jgi:AraC family transcriptional regulator
VLVDFDFVAARVVQTTNIEHHTKGPGFERDDLVGGVPAMHAERSRSWKSISAAVINRSAGEVEWSRSDRHRLHAPLTPIEGVGHVDNGPAQPLRFSPGEFSFTPSGVSTRTDLSAGRFIQILQNPETYDAIIAEIVQDGAARLETRHPIQDPLVSQVASTIIYETHSGFLDDILVDALNTALAVRIVRHFVDPSRIASAPSNGLSRERLQRVRDYVEGHLDDRLTLADLAGVACLSLYHFSRSFKQAVGVGPQRYVMQRRIERAKTLIRRTNQPLAFIAQEAGFSDQSHLTLIFCRETGMTPGRYRAARA